MFDAKSLLFIKNEAKTEKSKLMQKIGCAYLDGYMDAEAVLSKHISKLYQEKNLDASPVYRNTREVTKYWNKREDEIIKLINSIAETEECEKKENSIYLLYTCDQWKSTKSMGLVGISTNFTNIKKAIKTLIKNNVIELSECEEFDTENNWNVQEINNNINYLYLCEVSNDEFHLDGGFII